MSTVTKLTPLDYILFMGLIFASGSFWAINQPGMIRIILLLLFDVLLLFKRRKFVISKIEVLIIGLVSISMFLNFESIKVILIYLVYFISAIMLKHSYSYNNFKLLYVRIMSFVSLMGVILWLLLLVFPGITSFLPLITNSNKISVWNAYIAVQECNSIRIQGFFWEPGAFQVFAGIAVIILLFNKDLEIPYKSIRTMLFINIIAMGLTLSTTAYLVLACIFALVIFNSNYKVLGERSKSKAGIIVALCFVIMVVLLNLPAKYQYLIFGKIQAFITNADTNTMSVTSRVDAVKGALLCFIKSPLWGCGETLLINYMEKTFGHSNAVVTYLNFFAMFGVVTGCLFCKAMYRFFHRINNNKYIAISLFIIVGIMTFSENFIVVPIFLTFLFWGLDENWSTIR